MRVLVIEDESKLADYVKRGLSEAGYTVDVARDGIEGRYLALEGDYQLLVLDIMLPGIDGFGVLAALREKRNTPVLMLTARDRVEDRVQGLQAGADDYLVKPFDLPELSARLRALLRRRAGRHAPQIELGSVTIDPVSREVRLAGALVELTAQEYALVIAFAEQPRRVLTRSQLEDAIYTLDGGALSNVVEVYVSRLRRKFGRDSIRTVRGVGYRWGTAEVATDETNP